MKTPHSITTNSPVETEQLGFKIGQAMRGGEVLVLQSDVGGGKTTLVRGIAQGAGSQDAVASPTFTISKLYQAGNLTLAHFDFYRLDDPGIIENELEEFLQSKSSVVIIEWPKLIEGLLPLQKLVVSIQPIGESMRTFHFEASSQLKYVLRGLV